MKHQAPYPTLDISLRKAPDAGDRKIYRKWAALAYSGPGGWTYELVKLPTIDEMQRRMINEGLRSVDTITVRTAFRFRDPTAGRILTECTTPKKDGFRALTYVGWRKARSGRRVTVRYLPWTRNYIPYLSFTFSVPKLLYGNNHHMIAPGTDIIAMLDAELAPISEELGIPPMDILSWEIRGIDISTNYPVGENLERYLAYIKTCAYPRRIRGDYNNRAHRKGEADPQVNGISFMARSVRSTFYDKELECGSPLAYGKLRHECSFRDAKAVHRLFQREKPRLMDLTPEICRKAFQNDLNILGLCTPVLSRKVLFERLLEQFSPNTARDLRGFIALEMDYPGLSCEEAGAKYRCSAKTVRDKRHQLREAGISSWEDEEICLPGLELDIADFPILADGAAVFTTAIAHDGETCAEVPHYILPAARDMILLPAPIHFVSAGEVDELASELFGAVTLLVFSKPQGP